MTRSTKSKGSKRYEGQISHWRKQVEFNENVISILLSISEILGVNAAKKKSHKK